MIKTVAVIAVFFLPLFSFSQNSSVAALHKKYKNDNSFSLSVTGDILKFLGDSDLAADDPDLRQLAKTIQSLRILAVSSGSKNYSPKDIRKLKREIRKQPFEELFSLKSDGGQLQLLLKDRNGKPSELIMILDNDADGFITMDLSEKK
jgi:hypothetical protein